MVGLGYALSLSVANLPDNSLRQTTLCRSLLMGTLIANPGDMNRMEAFLRRVGKSGYTLGSSQQLPSVNRLMNIEQSIRPNFMTLKYNLIHPLHRLLPPECSTP